MEAAPQADLRCECWPGREVLLAPGLRPELRRLGSRLASPCAPGECALRLGDDAPEMRGVGVNPDALKRVPMGRKGVPMDIANAVMFLASPASDYIAGHSLVVDAGWTIQ